MSDYVEYKILGSFNVHNRTSMGFWQVSQVDLPLTQQLLDCHDFLLDCEQDELCIYTGTELYEFCQSLIDFLNDNDLFPCDLSYYERNILGLDNETYYMVISEAIDYTVPNYCNDLVSNPELSFGSNPNGGCLGFWPYDELEYA